VRKNIHLHAHVLVVLVVVLVGKRLLAERFLELFDGIARLILYVSNAMGRSASFSRTERSISDRPDIHLRGIEPERHLDTINILDVQHCRMNNSHTLEQVFLSSGDCGYLASPAESVKADVSVSLRLQRGCDGFELGESVPDVRPGNTITIPPSKTYLREASCPGAHSRGPEEFLQLLLILVRLWGEVVLRPRLSLEEIGHDNLGPGKGLRQDVRSLFRLGEEPEDVVYRSSEAFD
jgi:hypothetical protein